MCIYIYTRKSSRSNADPCSKTFLTSSRSHGVHLLIGSMRHAPDDLLTDVHIHVLSG